MFEYGVNSIANSQIFRNFSPSPSDFNENALKFSIDAILSSSYPRDGIIRDQLRNIDELQTCCVNYYDYRRRYSCIYDNFGISSHVQQHSRTLYDDRPTSLHVPTMSRYANIVIDSDKELLSSAVSNKRKRIWSRAVFSKLQRKGLEKRFQAQKYIMKPDRKQLAASLGLTDAQVKVWFQNRRMKWRNCKENSANKTASKKKN